MPDDSRVQWAAIKMDRALVAAGVPREQARSVRIRLAQRLVHPDITSYKDFQKHPAFWGMAGAFGEWVSDPVHHDSVDTQALKELKMLLADEEYNLPLMKEEE